MASLNPDTGPIQNINTPLNFVVPPFNNGINTGAAQVLASASTIALAPTSMVISHTPTQSESITVGTLPVAGTELWLVVTTSGTSSFTLTFSTGFKITGTLATGTSSGKVFVINFISDGTNLNEVARTTAM